MAGAIASAALLKIAKELAWPIIKRYVGDKVNQDRALNELELAALEYDTRQVEARKEILMAELQGTKMQRHWRPALMYLLMGFLVIYGAFLPLYNFFARPIFNSLLYRWTCYVAEKGEEIANTGIATACIILPEIDPVKIWDGIPPQLWTLLTIAIGGYIGGRSLEKIAGASKAPSLREDARGVIERVASPVVTMFDAVRRKRDPETGAKVDEAVPERRHYDPTLDREVIEVPLSDH